MVLREHLRRLLFCGGMILVPVCAQADELVDVVGQVIDEQGKPVAGIQVAPLSQRSIKAGVTDEKGAFRVSFSADDGGSPMLLAKDEAGTKQGLILLAEKDRLAASLDKEPQEHAKIVLKGARKLAVEVRDVDGKPVHNAIVSANASYHCLGETTTDAGGLTTLRVPADAQLDFVLANKDEVGLDYIVFQKPDEKGGDPNRVAAEFSGPFELSLEGVRPMRIRLVNGHSEPIPGVDVLPSYVKLPKKGGDALLGDIPRFKVATDKDGVASFLSMPKGNTSTVQFFVLSKTQAPQNKLWFAPTRDADQLTVKVLPTVPISGQLVLADGKPAGVMQIKAVGQGYQYEMFFGATKSDDQGRFTLLAHPNQFLTLQATAGKLCSGLETFVVLRDPPEREIKLTVKEGTRVFGLMTAGADRQPLSDQQVSLMQSSSSELLRLPKAEQLPNVDREPKSFREIVRRSTITDMQGRFEFWVPSGQHSLFGQNGAQTPFTVAAEKERKVDLHATGDAE